MTTAALGSWRKPPLAYVVAEIGFSVLYDMGKHKSDYQAAIRHDFPRTREAMSLRVTMSEGALNPQPEAAWHFVSENQRLGVNLTARSLALHATEYRNFASFCDVLSGVLAAAEKHIPDLFVERLGLRYIDYLLPDEGQTTFDLVVDSVKGIKPEGARAPLEVSWLSHFPFEKGGVNLRVFSVLAPGVSEPPAFGGIGLLPADTQAEAARRAKAEQSIGCIDTDRIMPVDKRFEANELLALFDLMHTDVSNTFQTVISDKAKKLWI